MMLAISFWLLNPHGNVKLSVTKWCFGQLLILGTEVTRKVSRAMLMFILHCQIDNQPKMAQEIYMIVSEQTKTKERDDGPKYTLFGLFNGPILIRNWDKRLNLWFTIWVVLEIPNFIFIKLGSQMLHHWLHSNDWVTCNFYLASLYWLRKRNNIQPHHIMF